MTGAWREDVIGRGMQPVRDRLTRMEQRVAEAVASRTADQFDAHDARLERAIDEKVDGAVARLVDEVVAPRLAAIQERLHADLRAEMVKLARMLRIQGDADDELAATLGRTLLRLSAEVEALDASIAHLEATAATRRAAAAARTKGS